MPAIAQAVCVLTGDIVKSTALNADQRQAVMAALEAAADTIAGWHGDGVTRYERFRGDGWQMLLGEPKWALRASLLVRAAVRRACEEGETRLAAGIGPAEVATTLAASTGTAFEVSGRGLDELKTHQLWIVDGEFGAPAERALARGLFSVCDALSQGWTARQADIFARLAAPEAPAMVAVAEALSVQPQTVQTHFSRAGGHALLDAAQAFEQARP